MIQAFLTFSLTGLCVVMAASENRVGRQTTGVLTDAKPQIQLHDALDQGHTYINQRDPSTTKRLTKRTARKGVAMMERLLKGAEKITTTKNARFYIKPGDRQTALNDFNSAARVVIRPNMNNIKGLRRLGDILIGRVADRRLVLMLDGDKWHLNYLYNRKSPVLEIRSAADDLYDVIFYKMDK